MKELSIEEKAKRYDEAIERARYWEKNPTVWSSDDICQKLFPELKGSDDERIRKWIRKELESKYVVDNIVNNVMADKALAWLDKQGEQKPAWSKEDKNNILFLTSIIEECFKDKEKITLCGDTVCANFTKENVIDRLKSLSPQNRWKPSDEQMHSLKQAINAFPYETDYLELLYEQLKKLMEE